MYKNNTSLIQGWSFTLSDTGQSTQYSGQCPPLTDKFCLFVTHQCQYKVYGYLTKAILFVSLFFLLCRHLLAFYNGKVDITDRFC